jgi:hypothetical protein
LLPLRRNQPAEGPFQDRKGYRAESRNGEKLFSRHGYQIGEGVIPGRCQSSGASGKETDSQPKPNLRGAALPVLREPGRRPASAFSSTLGGFGRRGGCGFGRFSFRRNATVLANAASYSSGRGGWHGGSLRSCLNVAAQVGQRARRCLTTSWLSARVDAPNTKLRRTSCVGCSMAGLGVGHRHPIQDPQIGRRRSPFECLPRPWINASESAEGRQRPC